MAGLWYIWGDKLPSLPPGCHSPCWSSKVSYVMWMISWCNLRALCRLRQHAVIVMSAGRHAIYIQSLFLQNYRSTFSRAVRCWTQRHNVIPPGMSRWALYVIFPRAGEYRQPSYNSRSESVHTNIFLSRFYYRRAEAKRLSVCPAQLNICADNFVSCFMCPVDIVNITYSILS